LSDTCHATRNVNVITSGLVADVYTSGIEQYRTMPVLL